MFVFVKMKETDAANKKQRAAGAKKSPAREGQRAASSLTSGRASCRTEKEKRKKVFCIQRYIHVGLD